MTVAISSSELEVTECSSWGSTV